jgi:hypothetical protein
MNYEILFFLISVTIFMKFLKFVGLIVFDTTVKLSRPRYSLWSLDSSVGIATGYRLDGQGWNPGRDKIYFLSTASRPALAPTQPPIEWLSGKFP